MSRKIFDVEPVKKRLRSLGGNYKMSSAYEEPQRPKKTALLLPKKSRSMPETNSKKRTSTMSAKKEPFFRTSSPTNQRLTRSAEKSKAKKPPLSSSKKSAIKKEVDSEFHRPHRPTTIKVEIPDGLQNLALNVPKTSRGSLRFFEPDTPPIRNQNVFHSCIVCKEPTLLLTAEYQEQLMKNEMKSIELSQDELTPKEDPALQCTVCKKYFHLVCVFDEIQITNWAISNPKSFVCQECIRCNRCNEPIYDPGNVQCITCGNAYHEVCKPTTKISHDFPSLSRIWYCNICEDNLLNILDFKQAADLNSPQQSTSKQRPAKPKSASRRSDLNKSAESPVFKKIKLDKSSDSPVRSLRRLSSRTNPDSPNKLDSPTRSNRTKEISDGEAEKRRLETLNKLKESIRYNGEFQCIAAQESTFSRLNDEYLNEEEELNEPRLEHFIPFGSVGTHKQKETTETTFFYGPIAYKPRFNQFLRMIYPDYQNLSFCRRCLIALPSPASLLEHNSACTVQHPPGTLIYQEKNISVWEVVGKKEKTYSRRLAMFAKTFIGSKTVFLEVEQFNFYVLTENEGSVSVMAGYFSKEIKPTANNNLSCLLILPWLQRKGYGLFLIDLSYHLSLRERKIGSPEHPLSDAGLKTYRQYWYGVIMSWLREKIYHNEKIDLVELKEQKGIEMRDILETLIIADMTFILDDRLQINVEIPLYTLLSSLRRRYVKPKLLSVTTHAGPFTSYN